MNNLEKKKVWNAPFIEDLDAKKTKAGTFNGGGESVPTTFSGLGAKYNGNS